MARKANCIQGPWRRRVWGESLREGDQSLLKAKSLLLNERTIFKAPLIKIVVCIYAVHENECSFYICSLNY